MFSQGKAVEKIPPTKAALLENAKRATLQGEHIWGKAISQRPDIPYFSQCGWSPNGNNWKPFWSKLPEATESCFEFIYCGCKRSCSGNCQWFQAELKCTALCECVGNGYE